MGSFNSLTIVGNCGRDPELRYTPNGKAVTSFGVAVNSKKAKGEDAEVVVWFDVQCWERLAELAVQYLKKGSQVLVQGMVELNTWSGSDNQPRATMRVQARTIQFLGNYRDDRDGTGAKPDNSNVDYDTPF